MHCLKELKPIRIKQFLYCYFFVIVYSNNVEAQHFNKDNTTQQIVLGSIGNSEGFLFKNTFKNDALLTYNNPIRVSATLTEFSKASYKAYLKAKKMQPVEKSITLNDSLKSRPKFVTINIMDKVALLNALNATHNASVKNYLRHQGRSKIVTSLSIAFNKLYMEALLEADAVFLVSNENKTYVLQLYNNNELSQQIKFNQGVVFGYKSASNCWQENDRRQIHIVDLAEGRGCPSKTYKSAERAKKDINYFKF